MPKGLCFLATIAVLIFAGTAAAQPQAAAGARPGQAARPQAPPPIKLMSSDLSDGSKMPDKFTCSAGASAVSPALRWTAPARNTVTLVLIVHDMEGHPRKGTDDILHWMVWNIPSTATGLPEGIPTADYELPDGSYQTNGFVGQANAPAGAQGVQAAQPVNFGYRPPCPPQNVPVPHHYAFELFGLDTKLDLPASAGRADVMKAMDGHVTAHASLVVPFDR